MTAGKIEGPFVKAAILCQQILEEKDGVLTPVRIVDRFEVAMDGDVPAAALPPASLRLAFLAMFVKGDARSEADIEVRAVDPSGRATTLWVGRMRFPGAEDQGQHLALAMNIEAGTAGVYWFDVYVEGQRATRTPLRVTYTRQPEPGA